MTRSKKAYLEVKEVNIDFWENSDRLLNNESNIQDSTL